MVIFSKWLIVNVSVFIDSKFLGYAKQSIDNQNLYVLPWNTSFYNDNHLHNLSVEIKDNQRNIIKIGHKFSLDTTTTTLWTRSKLILFIHWPTFVRKNKNLRNKAFLNFNSFEGMVAIILALCVYIIILMFYRYRAKRMACK